MEDLTFEEKLFLLLVVANGGAGDKDDLIHQAVEWELANGPPDEEKLLAFAKSIPQHKWELAREMAERGGRVDG